MSISFRYGTILTLFLLLSANVENAENDADFSVATNSFAVSYNTWVQTVQSIPYGAYNAKEAIQWAEVEKGFRHLKTEHNRFFR